MSAVDDLQKAILASERRYTGALDVIRELDDVAGSTVQDLREAIELVRCLRRLCAGRSVVEIHAAFGAPGDFGYETPIGEALSALYRGGA